MPRRGRAASRAGGAARSRPHRAFEIGRGLFDAVIEKLLGERAGRASRCATRRDSAGAARASAARRGRAARRRRRRARRTRATARRCRSESGPRRAARRSGAAPRRRARPRRSRRTSGAGSGRACARRDHRNGAESACGRRAGVIDAAGGGVGAEFMRVQLVRHIELLAAQPRRVSAPPVRAASAASRCDSSAGSAAAADCRRAGGLIA